MSEDERDIEFLKAYFRWVRRKPNRDEIKIVMALKSMEEANCIFD